MLVHVIAAFQQPAVVQLGEHFTSASRHAAQWGYLGLTCVLGKDKGRPQIATPHEAFAVVVEVGRKLKTESRHLK